MSDQREHYKFSVEQYDLMVKHAILGKYDLVELLRGHILQKVRPVSPRHASTKMILNELLHRLIDQEAIVSPCGAIRLADSEPEPDLFLIKNREDGYMHTHPSAEDTLLVIEIADDTLEFDRTFKKKLYAENGIPEYWVINLIERQVEIYCSPQHAGEFCDFRIVSKESVALAALPEISVPMHEIFFRSDKDCANR